MSSNSGSPPMGGPPTGGQPMNGPPMDGLPQWTIAISLRARIVIWTLCGISILVVALRILSRTWVVRVIGLDDILIVLATIFGIGFAIMLDIAFRPGASPALNSTMVFVQIIPYALSTMFARLSFAVTLLEVLGVRRGLRRLLYVLMILQVIQMLVVLIVQLSACEHVDDAWTYTVTGDIRCVDKLVHKTIPGQSNPIEIRWQTPLVAIYETESVTYW